MTPSFPCIKLYIPEMCCGAETALIEKAFKGSDLIKDVRFDTLARTAIFTPANENVTAPMLITVVDSVGMQASEIRETILSEMSIRISAMQTEADIKQILDLIGLDCAVDKINKIVKFHSDAEHCFAILEKLQQAGYDAVVVASNKTSSRQNVTESLPWTRLGIAFVFAAAAEAIELTHALPEWAIMACAAIAILLAGFQTIFKGLGFLFRLIFNMDTLMSVAVIGAVCLGAWPEAAMVMVLYEIGEAIEDMSMTRARNAIRKLMDVAPTEVTVKVGESWKRMKAEAVPAGSLYRIEPGERAALDGMVEDGAGSMDESMITGESMPASKTVGSRVFAGTLALESTLTVRATAASADSMSARIIRAVEEAEQKKAPLQRFVDKFASRYTPTVFALAILTAILGPILSSEPWTVWIYRALVLLVISCPCALVISTPVTIVSAVSAAARRGILIKGGVYLEEGRKLRWLALDKTGTITHGKPAQTDFVTWGNALASDSRSIAASLAARSDHPVSKAVAQAAQTDGVALLDVAEFNALPGRGVQGQINGATYHLGNHRMLEELGQCTPELEQRIAALETAGKTVVMLVGAKGVHGLFAVADTIKDSSKRAIAELHALGINTVMLTGDNPHTAQAIAAQAGIDRAQGNQLPDDKLREVEQLSRNGKVGMVGDGINDAPALARADIGFAMGAAGTDTAIETADVALMDDDLRKIPTFVRLSRATAQVLMQNIVLALGIKAVFLVLTFTGHATMWMAVFADTGVAMLCVLNSIRVLYKK